MDPNTLATSIMHKTRINSGYGGVREGAGRPKGSKNRRTCVTRQMAEKIQADPVKFLLESMLNSSLSMKDRIECAKAVAPYIAPRLSSVEARVTNVKTHEEMLEELDD